MSLYKQTVEQALQRVSDLRGETTTNTDAVRIRFASKEEQFIAGRRKWRMFLRRLSSQAGDGTSDYTVGDATYPCKYKGTTEIFLNGTTEDKRYELKDYHAYTVAYNENNSARIAYEYYDPVNDTMKIHINAVPTASDTLYISYEWYPPVRTVKTDYIVCPDFDCLVNLILADIDDNEGGDDGDTYRNKAEVYYNAASAKEDEPNTNQIYQMPVIEGKGFGTY